MGKENECIETPEFGCDEDFYKAKLEKLSGLTAIGVVADNLIAEVKSLVEAYQALEQRESDLPPDYQKLLRNIRGI